MTGHEADAAEGRRVSHEPSSTLVAFDLHHVIARPRYGDMIRTIFTFHTWWEKACLLLYLLNPMFLYRLLCESQQVPDRIMRVLVYHYPRLARLRLPEWMMEVANCQALDRDTIDLILTLKSRGYRVALASNISTMYFVHLRTLWKQRGEYDASKSLMQQALLAHRRQQSSSTSSSSSSSSLSSPSSTGSSSTSALADVTRATADDPTTPSLSVIGLEDDDQPCDDTSGANRASNLEQEIELELDDPFHLFDLIFTADIIDNFARKPSGDYFARLNSSIASIAGPTVERVIFVDDSMSNIRSAEGSGLQGIHYTTPERVIERLQHLDLL